MRSITQELNLKMTHEKFFQAFKNAFGSTHEFERALIYEGFQKGNKGYLYLVLDIYKNFKILSTTSKNEFNSNVYPLLECDLNQFDILNFIEEIDYIKIANSYDSLCCCLQS